MDNVEQVKIERIDGSQRSVVDDIVTRELPLTIILNNAELVTLLCTPVNLKSLALGYLVSEGLLGHKGEIKKVIVDDNKGIVRVETKEEKNLAADMAFKRVLTSGCGRGASFYSFADVQEQFRIESSVTVQVHTIQALVKEFQRRSDMYRETGGVHSAALCNQERILIFADDIGRHNAVDKIFGECILNDISTANCLVITSGRISSEILIKIARRGIPFLISRSAPTGLGVRLADQVGVTLIGFARGYRMNVYTHGWRIIKDETPS